MDILYPPRCPFCGQLMKHPGICSGCRSSVRPIRDPYCLKCGKPLTRTEYEYCYDCRKRPFLYRQGRSLYRHDKQVARAIYQLKFHNKRYYAKIFGHEMAVVYGRWIRERDIQMILPVPIHPGRQRRRGYNQAELIAQALGEELNLPVVNDAMKRVRKTKPQKILNDRQREQNLKNAFAMNPGCQIRKNVLVIDDIYTTGSTINTMTKILLQSGVSNVYFLTISIGQGI